MNHKLLFMSLQLIENHSHFRLCKDRAKTSLHNFVVFSLAKTVPNFLYITQTPFEPSPLGDEKKMKKIFDTAKCIG